MSSFASAIIEKSVSDRLKSSMSISAVDFLLRMIQAARTTVKIPTGRWHLRGRAAQE